MGKTDEKLDQAKAALVGLGSFADPPAPAAAAPSGPHFSHDWWGKLLAEYPTYTLTTWAHRPFSTSSSALPSTISRSSVSTSRQL